MTDFYGRVQWEQNVRQEASKVGAPTSSAGFDAFLRKWRHSNDLADALARHSAKDERPVHA